MFSIIHTIQYTNYWTEKIDRLLWLAGCIPSCNLISKSLKWKIYSLLWHVGCFTSCICSNNQLYAIPSIKRWFRTFAIICRDIYPMEDFSFVRLMHDNVHTVNEPCAADIKYIRQRVRTESIRRPFCDPCRKHKLGVVGASIQRVRRLADRRELVMRMLT